MIAITSVGGRISEWSVTLPGSTHARMRTAAMAMTALPKSPPANIPVSGLPLSSVFSYPPTANRSHLCLLQYLNMINTGELAVVGELADEFLLGVDLEDLGSGA